VKSVPSASEPLSQLLCLRDASRLTEFSARVNRGGHNTDAERLADLFRLMFKLNTSKDSKVKRPIPAAATSNGQLKNQFESNIGAELMRSSAPIPRAECER
jgi:hypothetical protein